MSFGSRPIGLALLGPPLPPGFGFNSPDPIAVSGNTNSFTRNGSIFVGPTEIPVARNKLVYTCGDSAPVVTGPTLWHTDPNVNRLDFECRFYIQSWSLFMNSFSLTANSDINTTDVFAFPLTSAWETVNDTTGPTFSRLQYTGETIDLGDVGVLVGRLDIRYIPNGATISRGFTMTCGYLE